MASQQYFGELLTIGQLQRKLADYCLNRMERRSSAQQLCDFADLMGTTVSCRLNYKDHVYSVTYEIGLLHATVRGSDQLDCKDRCRTEILYKLKVFWMNGEDGPTTQSSTFAITPLTSSPRQTADKSCEAKFDEIDVPDQVLACCDGFENARDPAHAVTSPKTRSDRTAADDIVFSPVDGDNNQQEAVDDDIADDNNCVLYAPLCSEINTGASDSENPQLIDPRVSISWGSTKQGHLADDNRSKSLEPVEPSALSRIRSSVACRFLAELFLHDDVKIYFQVSRTVQNLMRSCDDRSLERFVKSLLTTVGPKLLKEVVKTKKTHYSTQEIYENLERCIAFGRLDESRSKRTASVVDDLLCLKTSNWAREDRGHRKQLRPTGTGTFLPFAVNRTRIPLWNAVGHESTRNKESRRNRSPKPLEFSKTSI